MTGLIHKKDFSEHENASNGVSIFGPLFQRRIEFHPARKPLIPNANGDFHLETLNPISDSQKAATKMSTSTLMGQKLDGNHFYEFSLDPDLTLKIRFQRIGAGLANLGNTCFLNSVLQCLTYTEPLAAYLQSGKHKTSCHVAGFCAMCAIQNHVMNALQSSGKILSPSHLVKNLRCISRNFRNSRQEDAHEYMVNLMESMHKSCLPYGVPSESPIAYEKSLVHRIFGGRLRSQVKCKQCSHASNTYDPFLDLSLEIGKADTLHKALVNFTAVEHLDGGEKRYRCDRCKEKVVAQKQLTIHKAPYVLTIHLKRFGSGQGEKIIKNVRFTPSLDLKPYVSGPYKGELKYTLYGVLVHAGWSTHSGHYYCFVRTSSGVWHVLDDNKVSSVSEKVVMEQKAYMLFYVVDRRNSSPKKPVGVHEIRSVSRVAEDEKIPVRGEGYQGSAQIVEKGTSVENSNLSQQELRTSKLPMENGVHCQVHDIKNIKCLSRPSNKGVDERVLPVHKGGSIEIPDKSTVREGDLKLEKSGPIELLNQPSAANGKRDDHGVLDKHGGQKTVNKHDDGEVLNKHDHCRKAQVAPTKLGKCPVPIGRKRLFFMALRQQKKYKHKRGKRIRSDMRNFSHKDSLKSAFSREEEASTSELTNPKSSDVSTKKRDIRERYKLSDAVLATDVPVNGLLKGNFVGREVNQNERGSIQNCLMGLLTRGLEEASVARWEGIEMETSHIDRLKDAQPRSIGYLLDEWDEEYDQGKRKKIRNTEDFSIGYNPFQDHVMKKAQSKTDWNQPPRIKS